MIEQLESRTLLCGSCDVTGDGHVTPMDALVVINAIHDGRSADVNRDGYTTPLDALVVINWLNQQQGDAEQTLVRVVVHSPQTVGFTEAEILFGIDEALAFWSQETDYEFQRVTSNADIDVVFAELYVGNGVHVRGEQIGNTVRLHHGVIPAGHHSGRNGPANQTLYYQVYANLDSLSRITAHEIGHWLGYGHSSDPSCLMHSNASSWELC